MKKLIYINDKLLKNEIKEEHLLNKFLFFYKGKYLYYIQYKYSSSFCIEQAISHDKNITCIIYNITMPINVLKLNSKIYDIFIL